MWKEISTSEGGDERLGTRLHGGYHVVEPAKVRQWPFLKKRRQNSRKSAHRSQLATWSCDKIIRRKVDRRRSILAWSSTGESLVELNAVDGVHNV